MRASKPLNFSFIRCLSMMAAFMVLFLTPSEILAGPNNDAIRVPVLVLSPPTKDISRDIGGLHESIIDLAFGRLEPIKYREHTVVFDVDYEETPDESECGKWVRDLLAKKIYSIILGPVYSGCVASILKEDLQIPMISSMATSSDLRGMPNSDWFFRATGDDKERAKQIVNYAATKLGLSKGERPALIVYDTNKDYFSNLKDNLQSFSKAAAEYFQIVKVLTFDQARSAAVVATATVAKHPSSREGITKHLSQSTPAKIEMDQLSEILSDFGKDFLIFILGQEENSTEILKQLNLILVQRDRDDLVFVIGDSNRIQQSSPIGARLIGNFEVPESDVATISSIEPEISQIRKLVAKHIIFEEGTPSIRTSNIGTWLLVYQIPRMLIPSIVESTIEKYARQTSQHGMGVVFPESFPIDIRGMLKAELQSREGSPSIFPRDRIIFVNSDLKMNFSFKVKKVIKSTSQETLAANTLSQEFFTIPSVTQKTRWLLDPIVVKLENLNELQNPAEVYLVREDGLNFFDGLYSQPVNLSARSIEPKATLTFDPLLPGLYRIESKPQYYGLKRKVKVGYSGFFITALIASFLAILYRRLQTGSDNIHQSKQKPTSRLISVTIVLFELIFVMIIIFILAKVFSPFSGNLITTENGEYWEYNKTSAWIAGLVAGVVVGILLDKIYQAIKGATPKQILTLFSGNR